MATVTAWAVPATVALPEYQRFSSWRRCRPVPAGIAGVRIERITSSQLFV
jgi:hypothetical protein